MEDTRPMLRGVGTVLIIAVILGWGVAVPTATGQIIDDTPEIPNDTPEPPDRPTVEDTPTVPETSTVPEPSAGSTSISGAAFSVPAALDDEVESYRDKASRDLAAHAFVLATPEDLYLVFTDSEPTTGKAEVTGRVLQTQVQADGMTYGAVFASSARFFTEGKETTISEIVSNQGQYDTKLVEVSANHRQLASLTDPDTGNDLTAPSWVGVLTVSPITASKSMDKIGSKARDFSISASSEKAKPSISDRVELLTQSDNDRLLTVGLKTAFWTDADTTADGIVLTPGSNARQFVMKYHTNRILSTTRGQPVLYVVQSELPTTTYESTSQLRSKAKAGEVVSVTARVVGHKISVQESIEHSTGCGEDQARIDTPSGPVCVNLAQDVMIHTGVAFNEPPTSREEVLFIVGASSKHLDKPNERFSGEYKLSGEVVSTSKIDSDLPDGKVLFIYSINKLSGFEQGELPGESKNITNSELYNIKQLTTNRAINKSSNDTEATSFDDSSANTGYYSGGSGPKVGVEKGWELKREGILPGVSSSMNNQLIVASSSEPRSGTIRSISPSSGEVYWQFSVKGTPQTIHTTQSNRVYVTSIYEPDQNSTNKFYMYAVDSESRDFLWNVSSTDGSFSKPVTYGEKVFITNSGGELYAIDSESGNRIWSTSYDVGLHLPNYPPNRPIVADDQLIISYSDANIANIQSTHWIRGVI